MTRTGPSALALPATALVVTVWLIVACAVGSPGSSPTPAAGTLGPTATTMFSPSPVVADSQAAATPTVTGTAAPRETQIPDETGSPASAVPPDGQLTAGTDTVAGHLGTYCWAGTCSDEFELPARASLPLITVRESSTELGFELKGKAPFVQWSAAYGAHMPDLISLGSGGSPYDPDSTASPPVDLTAAQFRPPPSGDWTLIVSVHFKDASTLVQGGDASYVWHVKVD